MEWTQLSPVHENDITGYSMNSNNLTKGTECAETNESFWFSQPQEKKLMKMKKIPWKTPTEKMCIFNGSVKTAKKYQIKNG